jgi:hypothetical protein
MIICWEICEMVKCPSHYIGAFGRHMCAHHTLKIYDIHENDKGFVKGKPHDVKGVDDLMREVPEECQFKTEMAVSQ